MNDQQWDIRIVANGKTNPSLGVYFPAPISRALAGANMFRATLTITHDGFLICPYVADRAREREKSPVELPDWGQK